MIYNLNFFANIFCCFLKYNGDLTLCVDAGCGSGQCSLLFSSHFKKVLATDISVSQIEVAKSHNHSSNIEFV